MFFRTGTCNFCVEINLTKSDKTNIRGPTLSCFSSEEESHGISIIRYLEHSILQ